MRPLFFWRFFDSLIVDTNPLIVDKDSPIAMSFALIVDTEPLIEVFEVAGSKLLIVE